MQSLDDGLSTALNRPQKSPNSLLTVLEVAAIWPQQAGTVVGAR
jgi:hypothetical protein